MTQDRPAFLRLAIPIALFVVTFIALSPSLSCGFVDYDDQKLITENPEFRGLTPAHLRWMFSATIMGHWQPLTWVSYAIDYKIAGLDPAQFHLTNLLLHSTNAVLLYLLIVRVLRAALADGPLLPLAAAGGALLWSIHPLRVESVTWVTERRDVLSAVFLLSSALAYLHAFPRGSTRPASIPLYLASIALLAVSLMAKAWGMSFFAVALVLDWYPLHRLYPAAILQKAPYLLLGLASAAMASHAQRSIGAMRTLDEWPLYARIVQCFYGMAFYIAKTLLPTKLCALYELPHGLSPWEPRYVACYFLVITGAISLLLLHKRFPALLAAVLIYGLSVAPVLGLFQSGDQFVADRYSYIACMPWSALLTAGLLLAAQRARPLILAAPLIPALILGALTWRQAQVWTDSITLWRHAWQSDPSRMIPHIHYGLNIEDSAREFEKKGLTVEARKLDDEAEEHYRTATRLKPTDGRGWYTLGNLLKRRGDRPGAEAAYRNSAKTIPQAYLPLVNLGYLLLPDRPDEALAAFRSAIDAVEHPRPGSVPSGAPYLALGDALKKQGDIAGARDAFNRAISYAQSPGGSPAEKTRVKSEAHAQLAALPGGG